MPGEQKSHCWYTGHNGPSLLVPVLTLNRRVNSAYFTQAARAEVSLVILHLGLGILARSRSIFFTLLIGQIGNKQKCDGTWLHHRVFPGMVVVRT